MKAARFHQFGGAESVVIDEVPRPTPTADQLLIRVHTAGVNPIDVATHTGGIRSYGFEPQLPFMLGWEVSGVVEAVGANVREFQPGDTVVAIPGMPGGGFAEYVAVTADLAAHKPVGVSHIDIAGVPVAGLAAWQALFDHGQVQRGQRVLVLAASGGVGTFAVQFARWAGAEVWGTTSTHNMEFVRSLGATPIDYTAYRNWAADRQWHNPGRDRRGAAVPRSPTGACEKRRRPCARQDYPRFRASIGASHDDAL